MATTLADKETDAEDDDNGLGEGSRLSGQMSFLEHLDELRRRITRSAIFVVIALIGCWFVSNHIYNFLSVPVRRALAEAQRRPVPLEGLTGQEAIAPIGALKEGDTGRYVFSEATKLGTGVIPEGATVMVRAAKDRAGQLALYTAEPLISGANVIPAGVRLPLDLALRPDALPGGEDRLVVTTALEPFSLYLQVSLYGAICLSVPFLLWQIWGFVSPGLYPHERGYALPFVVLSTISFVVGAAFAYYVLFPPAARYLLGLGQDFRLLLKATDYFDFIVLMMLAMGLVFQMPAVTYVLSRIGLVTAGFLIRTWRIALVVILVAAAVLSPTNDIPNMMLFAAPMVVLYLLSILVAWIFGKPRQVEV
jgi:sec-independent protein translocase protein TatC